MSKSRIEIENYIKEHFSSKQLKEIAEDLKIDKRMVGHYARNLGLSKREVRFKEVKDFVLKNHKSMSVVEMSEELNASGELIRRILIENQLYAKDYRFNGSSEKESKIELYIRENFEHKSLKQIAEDLNITSSRVGHIARRLGLNKRKIYLERIKEFVLSNHNEMTVREMALKLNSSPETIKEILKENNIKTKDGRFKDKSNKKLSDTEVYILENFDKKKLIDIAVDLNLDKRTVGDYARKLGLRKREVRLEEVTNFVLKHYKEMTVQEMVKSIKSTRLIVDRILRENELTAKIEPTTKRVSEETLKIEEYVKEHFESKMLVEIAEDLDVDPRKVGSVARRLGLRKLDRKIEDVTKLVLENHKDMSLIEMSEKFNASFGLIKRIVDENELQVRKYSRVVNPKSDKRLKAEKYITEHFHTKMLKDIAEDLNIDSRMVGEYARKLGLSKVGIKNEEAKNFVLAHYATLSVKEMTAKSGYSDGLIRRILEENNLKPLNKKTMKSRERLEIESYIRENFDKKMLKDIAEELGVDKRRIGALAREMGLRKRP